MGENDSGAGPVDEASFDELVEIERATALIQDRDPGQAEAVVAARFAARTEKQHRAAQLEKLRAEAAKKRKKRLRRIVVGVVLAVVAVAAGWPLSRAIEEEAARADSLRKRLGEASAPVAKGGFGQRDEWLDVGAGGVSLEIPKGVCSAVVAVRESGEGPLSLRLDRGKAKAIEGPGGHVWCSCDAEQITVTVTSPEPGRIALRWLATGAAVVGGIEVLSAGSIPGFSVHTDDLGLSCADRAFETWSGKSTQGRVAPLGAGGPPVARELVAEGLTVAGRFPAARRFAVLPVDHGDCVLVVPEEPTGTVELRAQDGARLTKSTGVALAFCAYAAAGRYSLWRAEGDSADWLVLSSPSKQLGGMAGLHAVAARRGIKPLLGRLTPDELTDDAVAALEASTVTPTTIVRGTGAGLPAKPDQRVVAFSMFQAGAYVAEQATTIPVGCHPMPDPEAALNAFVCVQGKPQQWRTEGAERSQAAASAKLPFWLGVLSDQQDLGAMQAAALLLGFARRMNALGAEPTTAFGIEEAPWGARVTGHPKKKRAIAVGITKSAPWVHPLTDGAPWTLEGPMPTIEVPKDGAVELKSQRPLGFDAAARRVVLWRW